MFIRYLIQHSSPLLISGGMNAQGVLIQMRYNRKSPLRYVFGVPVEAYFKIIKVDDRDVTSSEGKAEIINISQDGMKIISDLNIPDVTSKKISLSIRFVLNDSELLYNGEIVWKKEKVKKTEYGIHMKLNEDEREQLIEQLKIFTKKLM